jgi:hypothetical protein
LNGPAPTWKAVERGRTGEATQRLVCHGALAGGRLQRVALQCRALM